MPIVLVTGCAGFIGSRLTRALLDRGDFVRGVDCLRPYYDISIKQRNLAGLEDPRFTYHYADLGSDDLSELLDGVDVIYHQAAQAGVRPSWGQFDQYVHDNIRATERLLRACVGQPTPPRVVYASSSSIYGDADTFPVLESRVPAPVSPYGVTKLAAEHLCAAYARNYEMTCIALRYFTVYGPGQRPDMAINRLVAAALGGSAFPMYGNGRQIRDFTFIDDAVRANLMAADSREVQGFEVVNVAGGGSISLLDLIALVEGSAGERINVERRQEQKGDVFRTGGSLEAASRLLGWEPKVSVPEGVAAQVEWQRQILGVSNDVG